VLNAKGEPVLESTMIFHDMRRSAVRNLERAGVSQAGAMKVTGHKTISVYQRYRIVNEADIRDALTRTEAAMSEQKERKIIALREREEAARNPDSAQPRTVRAEQSRGRRLNQGRRSRRVSRPSNTSSGGCSSRSVTGTSLVGDAGSHGGGSPFW